jgi:flagellin-like hook-associated protein FlgL
LTALDSNDINGIQSALDQFPTAFADLGQARGQIGSNLSLLESISGVLASSEFNMVERRSNIEDADLADVAVQLKQTQTALEAAMSAGGSVLTKPNLFDILG